MVLNIESHSRPKTIKAILSTGTAKSKQLVEPSIMTVENQGHTDGITTASCGHSTPGHGNTAVSAVHRCQLRQASVCLKSGEAGHEL